MSDHSFGNADATQQKIWQPSSQRLSAPGREKKRGPGNEALD